MRSSLPSKVVRAIPRPVYPRRNLGPGRTYHSDHHPEPPPFPDAQERILAAALRHVPTHGFSSKALAEGAKDSGYLEVSVQLFPRGVFDLVNFHLVTQRLALKDRVQFQEDSKLGVGQRVRTLTIGRLRANQDIIHQWQGVGRYHQSIFSSCR
jgi:ubiquinone biosynthesis protein COQ9